MNEHLNAIFMLMTRNFFVVIVVHCIRVTSFVCCLLENNLSNHPTSQKCSWDIPLQLRTKKPWYWKCATKLIFYALLKWTKRTISWILKKPVHACYKCCWYIGSDDIWEEQNQNMQLHAALHSVVLEEILYT